LDPLRHFSDRGGMCGPTQRRIAQGGNPAGLKLEAGWVEVALARCQTMGRPYLDNTAQTEVRIVEDPPNQVRAVESRGGTGGGGVRGRKWWKDGLGKVKQGQREVGKGESDAFRAG
jgi:hypothetical protein